MKRIALFVAPLVLAAATSLLAQTTRPSRPNKGKPDQRAQPTAKPAAKPPQPPQPTSKPTPKPDQPPQPSVKSAPKPAQPPQPAPPADAKPLARPASGEVQWIWSPEQTGENVPAGVCYFRRAFDLGKVEQGRLSISCDDRYELYVNGRLAGSGNDWRNLDMYDITKLLTPGRNAIAVKAENVHEGSAGLVVRVVIRQAGGTDISYSTDKSWKTSLKEETGWQKVLCNDARWAPAHVWGEFGRTEPWADQVQANDGSQGGRFMLPKQFRVERVGHPDDTGSLLAMAFNEWGQIVASREGGGLEIVDVSGAKAGPDAIANFTDEVKNSQGVLCLNGMVFVVGDGPQGAGLYRLADADQDGKADESKLLLKFKGDMSEHGPHVPVLGPDGMIYVLVGNFGALDADFLATSPLRTYYEGDLVQPRYEDAGGHDVGIKAPGGIVVRTDVEGSFVELFAGGLRNPYDIAFNRQGDLFTFDSDMEWDIGLPWYRPTRINHLVPGSESGWRSGWAKWPDYYLDSLPATMDIGRGSPTGLEFYDHDKYPKRYRNALFACDWAQGRILALMFQQAGGTYACGGEVFLQGQPLNVTDVAVGPDGWLYFCTGGRETEGGVYRIVYQGKLPPPEEPEGILRVVRQPQLNSAWAREQVATVKEEMGADWQTELARLAADATAAAPDRARALDMLQLFGPAPETSLLVKLARDQAAEVRIKAAYLMGVHADALTNAALVDLLADADPMVRRTACESLVRAGHMPPLEKLPPLLADPDRFVSFAARRVLESVPLEQWRARVLGAKHPRVFIEGTIALLTVGADRNSIDTILARAGKLMEGFTTDEDFLDLLRVIELALDRGAVPPEDVRQLRHQLAEEYPSLDPRINRELIRLMVYLQDASATDRLVEGLRGTAPLVEKIHLAAYCRFLSTNWTFEQKLELLKFYEAARVLDGGHSYALYLNNFATDYVKSFTPDEQRLVIENALTVPTAALAALTELPENPEPQILEQLIALDRELKALNSEAARQLGVGILAILGESLEPDVTAYLREVFVHEPERRPMVAMALAQSPGGENWPLLLQSLPIVDGGAAQEVLAKLANVDQVPDKPEDFRQAILCGLRLGEGGSQQAVTLLEKWTHQKLSQPDDSWDVALAAWQKWFVEKYPNQPEPVLPQESAESRWSLPDLLLYLAGEGHDAGDADRGRVVFEKAQCIKCHRFGGRGEGIGPDLTTINRRFQVREILESVLFPSQVISDQYASKSIVTNDGRSYTGMVAPSGADAIVVLEANGRKTTLRKSDIDETHPSRKSSMPDGLFNDLTQEEIADLFAYLYSAPTGQ